MQGRVSERVLSVDVDGWRAICIQSQNAEALDVSTFLFAAVCVVQFLRDFVEGRLARVDVIDGVQLDVRMKGQHPQYFHISLNFFFNFNFKKQFVDGVKYTLMAASISAGVELALLV